MIPVRPRLETRRLHLRAPATQARGVPAPLSVWKPSAAAGELGGSADLCALQHGTHAHGEGFVGAVAADHGDERSLPN